MCTEVSVGSRRAYGRLSRVRRAAKGVQWQDIPLLGSDALLVASSYVVALLLRFDGAVDSKWWTSFWNALPVLIAVHIGAHVLCRCYGTLWRHASVIEARRVVASGVLGGSVLMALSIAWERRVPLSVVMLGASVTTVSTGALRFQSRFRASSRATDLRSERRSSTRVAVVGAGSAGAAIVRDMQASAELRPVEVFDDDLRKVGRSLLGVPIVGAVEMLADRARSGFFDQVVLAVPSAPGELVRRVEAAARHGGVPLRVLPTVAQLVRGTVSIREVRDLQIEDLLGRDQIQTDLDGVRRALCGKTVLITGAGGSIGGEIARQVVGLGLERLLLLDHDETHLFDLAATLEGPATLLLADIRDAGRISELSLRHRPDVVFHAAAHKHVPILEDNACEAVQTNVFGTQNVVRAAAQVGVELVVFISTDKAVSPKSVMGASKWLGEQIVLSGAAAGSRQCAVRFGNVIGSRGSVIPAFERQIAAGGPVTVTDPRMTRYFMSIAEAVQLVLQASVLARGGEVFILDMGKPVNILHLARRMIDLAGKTPDVDVQISFVGTRPGEKLTEDLLDVGEEARATVHPSISQARPLRMPRESLDRGLADLRDSVDRQLDAQAAALLLDMPVQAAANITFPAVPDVLITS